MRHSVRSSIARLDVMGLNIDADDVYITDNSAKWYIAGMEKQWLNKEDTAEINAYLNQLTANRQLQDQAIQQELAKSDEESDESK